MIAIFIGGKLSIINGIISKKRKIENLKWKIEKLKS